MKDHCIDSVLGKLSGLHVPVRGKYFKCLFYFGEIGQNLYHVQANLIRTFTRNQAIKLTFLLGVVVLWITFSSCSHGPTRAQQFAATMEARNQSFQRTMASIKRLPPEERLRAYEELQADLDRQQAIQAQQDINASIEDLADAVRGY